MLGESMRRRRKLGTQAVRAAGDTGPRWSRWILAGILALPLGFGTGYGVAVQFIFPVPEVVEADAVVVPAVVGDRLEEAERALEAVGLGVAQVMELPHPSEPEGVVIAQAPLARQQLRPGAEVSLAVSTGPAPAIVPDVVGLPIEDATALAEQIGFDVNRLEEVAAGPAGMVVRTVPEPGSERELPAAITLVVSTPPKLILPGDSASGPLDSLGLPMLPDLDTLGRRLQQ